MIEQRNTTAMSTTQGNTVRCKSQVRVRLTSEKAVRRPDRYGSDGSPRKLCYYLPWSARDVDGAVGVVVNGASRNSLSCRGHTVDRTMTGTDQAGPS